MIEKKEQDKSNKKLQNLEVGSLKQNTFIPYGGNALLKWKRGTRKRSPVVKWTRCEKN
jgi:hypothetical protein